MFIWSVSGVGPRADSVSTLYCRHATVGQRSPYAYADDLQIYSECRPADVVCLQDSMFAMCGRCGMLDGGQLAAA